MMQSCEVAVTRPSWVAVPLPDRSPTRKQGPPGAAGMTISVKANRAVKELEAGDLSLERSLELFERGMGLSEICRKQLEEAETRVEMLIRKDGAIQPVPFRPEK